MAVYTGGSSTAAVGASWRTPLSTCCTGAPPLIPCSYAFTTCYCWRLSSATEPELLPALDEDEDPAVERAGRVWVGCVKLDNAEAPPDAYGVPGAGTGPTAYIGCGCWPFLGAGLYGIGTGTEPGGPPVELIAGAGVQGVIIEVAGNSSGVSSRNIIANKNNLQEVPPEVAACFRFLRKWRKRRQAAPRRRNITTPATTPPISAPWDVFFVATAAPESCGDEAVALGGVDDELGETASVVTLK